MSKIKFTTQQPTPPDRVMLRDLSEGDTFRLGHDIYMYILIADEHLQRAMLNLKTGNAWNISDPSITVIPIEITAQYQPTSP